jgi:mRNA interferase RelE/StbE
VGSYEILIKPSAVKELESLLLRDRRRIVARIEALAQEPRPRGCERLGAGRRYRLRQGNFRILFEVDDAAATVTVAKVGHRRDVYR